MIDFLQSSQVQMEESEELSDVEGLNAKFRQLFSKGTKVEEHF